MLGALGINGDGLSLRQIVQRYDGRTYQQQMIAGSISASLFNAQGGLTGGEPASFKDFHPEHSVDATTDDQAADSEEAHKLIHARFSHALNMVPL